MKGIKFLAKKTGKCLKITGLFFPEMAKGFKAAAKEAVVRANTVKEEVKDSTVSAS